MKLNIAFGLLLFSFSLKAADPKFPVTAIPDSLRKDVDVVIRQDNMVYKIISRDKGELYVYYAATILNEKGKDFAHKVLGYDKLSKIKNVSANIYDANGEHVKKIKNSEIYDQSAFDGISLFSDNRIKSIDMTYGSYPFTVEIEYEIAYNFLFHIEGSIVVPEERVSVEHFSYKLIFPSDLAPRYKTFNISTEPVRGKTPEGQETLTWSIDHVLPIKEEPYALSNGFPRIIAAPGLFEYDGYTGNMSSWNEFGKWVSTLNKNRNSLPVETKETIIKLSAQEKTKEEKVKTIYEYLQSKTRYVSIQLGIGGYQPFEASVVDQTGYGDCKALSNYMVAMLETIGIKSHYALIRAGKNSDQLDMSFPSSQFNHAIVAVPNDKDTLWLECTSQTNPFGYQGTFTGDRKALLITDDGAKIVNTTQYPAEVNIQSRTADVFLDLDGDAKAKIETTYSGLQYENDNLDYILTNQYDDQKKWLQTTTKIPSFDINSFSMTNKKAKTPSALIKLDLNLRRYATVSGKRIFLSPNLMNRSTHIPEKVEQRKTSVVKKNAFTNMDTILYHIPENIYPEYLPEPVKLTTRYGVYEASFKIDQGNLIYTRMLKINKGVFPPESYNELIDFYKNISKADNTKVVFMTKT